MSVDQALLRAEDVMLDLHVTTRQGLFDVAAAHFARHWALPQATIVDRLLARERIGSTGLGQGLAIPHARLEEATNVAALFVRPEYPISFDAPDGKPVSDLLLMVVPARSPQMYLVLLSEIAQLFGDRAFREKLRAASDPAAVAACFASLNVSSS